MAWECRKCGVGFWQSIKDGWRQKTAGAGIKESKGCSDGGLHEFRRA